MPESKSPGYRFGAGLAAFMALLVGVAVGTLGVKAIYWIITGVWYW